MITHECMKKRCIMNMPNHLLIAVSACLILMGTALFAQENVLVSEEVIKEIPGNPTELFNDRIANCDELFEVFPNDGQLTYIEVNEIVERNSSLLPDTKGLKNEIIKFLTEKIQKSGRTDVKIVSTKSITNQVNYRITVGLRFLKKTANGDELTSLVGSEANLSEYLESKPIEEISKDIECVELSFEINKVTTSIEEEENSTQYVTINIVPTEIFQSFQYEQLWEKFIKGFLMLNSHKQKPSDVITKPEEEVTKPEEEVTKPSEVLVLSEMTDLEVKFHVSNEPGNNYHERPFLSQRNLRGDPVLLLKPSEFYEIELINQRSDMDLVARVYVDGVNATHFKDNPEDASMFLVPKNGKTRIKGWYKNSKQSYAFAIAEYGQNSPLLVSQEGYLEFKEKVSEVIDNTPNFQGNYHGIILVRYTAASEEPFKNTRGDASNLRTEKGPLIDTPTKIKRVYYDNSGWENIPVFYRSPGKDESIPTLRETSSENTQTEPEKLPENELLSRDDISGTRGSGQLNLETNTEVSEPLHSDLICSPENRWAIFMVSGVQESSTMKKNIQSMRNGFLNLGIHEDHIFVMSDDAEDKQLLPTVENINKQLGWIKNIHEPGPLDIQKRSNTATDTMNELWLIVSLPNTKDEQGKVTFSAMDQQNAVSLDTIRESFNTSEISRRFLMFCMPPADIVRGGSQTSIERMPVPINQWPQNLRKETTYVESLISVDIFLQPESQTSFVSVFQNALSSYADKQVAGNNDGYISSNELVSYLSYYANQSKDNSFRVLAKGVDFPLTTINDNADDQLARSNAKEKALNSLNGTLNGTLNNSVSSPGNSPMTNNKVLQNLRNEIRSRLSRVGIQKNQAGKDGPLRMNSR